MAEYKNELKKKKIGIFSGYYVPHLGGVERYVDKLSAALVRLGYEVVIVTSKHDDLKSVEQKDGRTVYRLPIRNIAKERYPIPNPTPEYKRLMQEIENEGIDVFLLNTRFHLTSLVGARMGKRLGRHVMLIDHGTGHFTVNSPVLDFFGKIYEHVLTWWMKRYVDNFYGVSEACNVWLKHFSIRGTGVFYNSIDPVDGARVEDYYKDTYSKDAVVISYAGRVIKEKGVLNLLTAFLEFEQRHPEIKAKLVIAGDGPLLEDIKRDYKSLSIDFIGKVDFAHVMALYKRSDIFVYPSLYPEGLPTSILEAGLMDCAVIATPRGGTTEVIAHEQHGIITDGSAAELADAIARLAGDSVLRHKFSQALKRKVEEQFNWDAVALAVGKEIRNLEDTRNE